MGEPTTTPDKVSMALAELVRKAEAHGDVDFLKEGGRVLSQALMEAMLVHSQRHLVKEPLVAASRAAPTKLACQQRAELMAPETAGFVADQDPPLGEQLLDIAVAEGEPMVQPDRITDDLWRETVASKRRDGCGAGGHEADPTLHARFNLSMPSAQYNSSLAMPRSRLRRATTAAARPPRSVRPVSSTCHTAESSLFAVQMQMTQVEVEVLSTT
jgi:hypothetical protein